MDDTKGTSVGNNKISGTEISIPENAVLIFKGVKAPPFNQLITGTGGSHDDGLVIDEPHIRDAKGQARLIAEPCRKLDKQNFPAAVFC